MKHNWLVTALVVLIAVLATLLVTTAMVPREAVAQTDSGTANYVVAIVGQQRAARSPLFLVDSKARTIMIYEYDQSIRRFYLRAVRSFHDDRQLEDQGFEKLGQNRGPSVKAVRKLIPD